MDSKVIFQNDLVDQNSNLPMPHLSFIINFLLPKRHVGIKRSERLFGDPDKAVVNEAKSIKLILVGSCIERYNLPYVVNRTNPLGKDNVSYRDMDILIEERNFVVETENIKPSSSSDKIILLLNHANIHPGYGKLQKSMLEPWQDDTVYNYDDKLKMYFLNRKISQNRMYEYLLPNKNFEIHGPALSFNLLKNGSGDGQNIEQLHGLDIDFVCAVRCRQWPSNAKSWIKRQEGNTWLSPEQIQSIVEKGIHLVPVAHKLSSSPDIEWRLSFAEAEVYLAHNVITDEQRQCYVFLKIIYVQTLKKLELLSSYHLKTVFLYCCEQLPESYWNENSGSCLLYMIDMIIECVINKFLPSFFIPENNLIDHLSDSEISKVLEVLTCIREFPISPVLEFTDVYAIGLQSITIPFRNIISQVLKDIVDFPAHRKIQKTTPFAFLSALLGMVKILTLKVSRGEAIRYVLDICPIINMYDPGFTSVSKIVDFVALNLIKDIELSVALIEEALKYSDSHPDVLSLRGNLACMFHALAYTHPSESEDRTLALVQAETLFYTVVDVEDFSSPAAVDFGWLLITQNRFEEAKEKLDRYIDARNYQATNMYCADDKEAPFLDEYIQNEIKTHGTFSVNSLSMAYYLLVKCTLRNDRSSADPNGYRGILHTFTVYCEKLNESTSYLLLGYAHLSVADFSEALAYFEKTLSTFDGNTQILKENIEMCKLQLLHL